MRRELEFKVMLLSFDSQSWITAIVQNSIAALIIKLISIAYIKNKEKIITVLGVANNTLKKTINTFFKFITEIFLITTSIGYLIKYINQYLTLHDNESITAICSFSLLLLYVVVTTYKRSKH